MDNGGGVARWARRLLTICCATVLCSAQTTHGVIAGDIVNALDGAPIAGADIRYTHLESPSNTGTTKGNANGRFTLPLLPPGTYRIRVEATGFQAQELYNLRLFVAGTLDLAFKLRPLRDVWEQQERKNVFLPGNAVAPFFGPDVDLSRTASVEIDPGRNGVLESTMSQVAPPVVLREAPLAGRDVYAVLAFQPGVASDAPTGRGLGLSVNGQRPSSTNYLLDGLENDNHLITGPLVTVAPEGIQEYRISTNNFSAEYGRASGVVANAVTRAGGSGWHGMIYANLKNEALNANDFQRNTDGKPRSPAKEVEPGLFVGGPLPGRNLFGSVSLDRTRFRSRADAELFPVPSAQMVAQLAPDSLAAKLLGRYPPPAAPSSGPCRLADGNGEDERGCYGAFRAAAPNEIDRTLALARIDRLFHEGAQRLLFRYATSRYTSEDFAWSPYPDFIAPLTQRTTSLAAGWTGSSAARGITAEVRVGAGADDLRFDRPHPDIPLLGGPSGMRLPGSDLVYSYRNRSRHLENIANLTMTKDRHIFKWGGGFYDRRIDGYQRSGRDGQAVFTSAADFAQDRPAAMLYSVSRANPALPPPPYDRDYEDRQWYGFFQHSWRAARRFNINYGVRYENFGTPANTGATKDPTVTLPAAPSLDAAIQASRGIQLPVGRRQRMYDPDNRDWAGRAGFAWLLDERAQTVVRGAYGIFYDRPFDNLWQTLQHNAVQRATFYPAGTWNYLKQPPPYPVDRGDVREIFGPATLFQPGIRAPYAQSAFLSVRRVVTQKLSVEISAMNSLGRELIATDVVNRSYAKANTDLPELAYRSNQGNSNYYAGSVVATYSAGRNYFEAAYTWSHAIDNQSDPIAGAFSDLDFTGGARGEVAEEPAFSVQYDSRVDRGNSSFDRRHNLVALGVVELPGALRGFKPAAALLRDWRISWLAGARSGSPYTVFAAPTGFLLDAARLINNRADAVVQADTAAGSSYPGGERLLNGRAFSQPEQGKLGTTGRNAFRGPGFWNLDFSLSRRIPIRDLGSGGRLIFRADAFNVFNHANLGSPYSILDTTRQFGVALYGRKGYDTGFPAVVPFSESARVVQLLLKLEF